MGTVQVACPRIHQCDMSHPVTQPGLQRGLFVGRNRPPIARYVSIRPVPRSAPTAAVKPSPTASSSGSLSKWAKKAGIWSAKVAQANFGGLRGYQALEDILHMEEFITVPRSAALVLNPGQQRPDDSVGAEYWHSAPWFIKMCLLLLRERHRGAASPLWGYIQQLPPSVDLPMRWSPAELQQLQYQPVIEEVQVQQQQWTDLYEDLGAALEAAGAPPLSWDEYLWAMENVCSRVFTERYPGAAFWERLLVGGAALAAVWGCALWQHLLPLQAVNATCGAVLAGLAVNTAYDAVLSQLKLRLYALVPVMDGANHLSSVQNKLAYDYLHDCFILRAASPLSRGQQVFINYGPHCNDSLLLYYGFVEPANPHDTYCLDVAAAGGSVAVGTQATGSGDR